MIVPVDTNKYENALEDFADNQNFESSTPDVDVRVSDAPGDGKYDVETQNLVMQVALEGLSHQLSEGIEKDITVIDCGVETGTVHEGTHREFSEHHPNQFNRITGLAESDPYQKAYDDAFEIYFEEHMDPFLDQSLEEWKKQTEVYRNKLIEKVEEYGDEEMAREVEKLFALNGIDENAARLAEEVFNGEDPTKATREEMYETSVEFDTYITRNRDVIRSDMGSMGDYVARNSLGDLLRMNEDDLIDRFYENPVYR